MLDTLEKELLRQRVLGVTLLPEQEFNDGVLRLAFEPKVVGQVFIDPAIPHQLDEEWARQFV